jgi:hypothetical protein
VYKPRLRENIHCTRSGYEGTWQCTFRGKLRATLKSLDGNRSVKMPYEYIERLGSQGGPRDDAQNGSASSYNGPRRVSKPREESSSFVRGQVVKWTGDVEQPYVVTGSFTSLKNKEVKIFIAKLGGDGGKYQTVTEEDIKPVNFKWKGK